MGTSHSILKIVTQSKLSLLLEKKFYNRSLQSSFKLAGYDTQRSLKTWHKLIQPFQNMSMATTAPLK